METLKTIKVSAVLHFFNILKRKMCENLKVSAPPGRRLSFSLLKRNPAMAPTHMIALSMYVHVFSYIRTFNLCAYV